MKKVLLLLAILFTLTACVAPEDENGDGESEPTPTPEEIVIDLNDGSPTPIPGDDIVIIIEPTEAASDLRPSTLPVLFEYQALGFDLEFFHDGSQYLYYGLINVPNTCYKVDKIVSVLTDVSPAKISMIFQTLNQGEPYNHCLDHVHTDNRFFFEPMKRYKYEQQQNH